MKIHDISMPLVDAMCTWPGDAPFAFRLNWQQASGASVNVGHMQMSVHVGTHADSPFHVDSAGTSMEALDLSTFIGPAVVLEVEACDRIELDLLHNAAARLGRPLAALLSAAPRLLLRTGAWKDRSRFPERFPTLSEACAQWLATSGAVLLGVDVPSVDPPDSKTLPIHHQLIGHKRQGAGVQILENLVLDRVAEGFYELIALPLPIVGGDGSPVRAVLIER